MRGAAMIERRRPPFPGKTGSSVVVVVVSSSSLSSLLSTRTPRHPDAYGGTTICDGVAIVIISRDRISVPPREEEELEEGKEEEEEEEEDWTRRRGGSVAASVRATVRFRGDRPTRRSVDTPVRR